MSVQLVPGTLCLICDIPIGEHSGMMAYGCLAKASGDAMVKHLAVCQTVEEAE